LHENWQKAFSFRGLHPRDPPQGALPLDPAGGSAPRPRIGSHAMGPGFSPPNWKFLAPPLLCCWRRSQNETVLVMNRPVLNWSCDEPSTWWTDRVESTGDETTGHLICSYVRSITNFIQNYVLWNALSVPLLHVTLCYDINDGIASYQPYRHSNDQASSEKVIFKTVGGIHTTSSLYPSCLETCYNTLNEIYCFT